MSLLHFKLRWLSCNRYLNTTYSSAGSHTLFGTENNEMHGVQIPERELSFFPLNVKSFTTYKLGNKDEKVWDFNTIHTLTSWRYGTVIIEHNKSQTQER